MAYKIQWSSEADSYVESIKDYFDARGDKKAKRKFLAHLNKQVSYIAMFPKMEKRSRKKPGYREYVLHKYLTLYYKFESNTVIIASIFDTRQDLDKVNI